MRPGLPARACALAGVGTLHFAAWAHPLARAAFEKGGVH